MANWLEEQYERAKRIAKWAGRKAVNGGITALAAAEFGAKKVRSVLRGEEYNFSQEMADFQEWKEKAGLRAVVGGVYKAGKEQIQEIREEGGMEELGKRALDEGLTAVAGVEFGVGKVKSFFTGEPYDFTKKMEEFREWKDQVGPRAAADEVMKEGKRMVTEKVNEEGRQVVEEVAKEVGIDPTEAKEKVKAARDGAVAVMKKGVEAGKGFLDVLGTAAKTSKVAEVVGDAAKNVGAKAVEVMDGVMAPPKVPDATDSAGKKDKDPNLTAAFRDKKQGRS